MEDKGGQPAIFDHRILFPDEKGYERECVREKEQLFLIDHKILEQVPNNRGPL